MKTIEYQLKLHKSLLQPLSLLLENNNLRLAKSARNDLFNSNAKPHNLYVISDGDINDGDWYFENDVLLQSINSSFKNVGHEKVIATTNKDLGLPMIPRHYIDEYIKEYNRNNQINSIFVKSMEYFDFKIGSRLKVIKNVHKYNVGDYITVSGFDHHNNPDLISFEEDDDYNMGFHISNLEHKILTLPIIDKHNFIIVDEMKKSWDKNELLNILEEYRKYAWRNGLTTITLNEFVENYVTLI